MSIAVFTDSAANLPKEKVEALNINVVCCSYQLNGKVVECPPYPEQFDGHEFYDALRNKAEISTSMTNAHKLETQFRPALENGDDIIYVCISSGISGTYSAGVTAALELAEEFPKRRVHVIDSMGAGLGIGILAMRAADYRDAGYSADEAAEKLLADRRGLCEYFTVDDLMFLKRGGRASSITAIIGTVLSIKPILRGDEDGKIVVYSKQRGRKKSIAAIAREYAAKVREPEKQRVAISHGDCPEDAETLAAMVREIAEPKELIIAMHEPYTGAHVGPGMLSLFFFSDGR